MPGAWPALGQNENGFKRGSQMLGEMEGGQLIETTSWGTGECGPSFVVSFFGIDLRFILVGVLCWEL
eukprot:2225595-Pyramimonas_sp.AAC.1